MGQNSQFHPEALIVPIICGTGHTCGVLISRGASFSFRTLLQENLRRATCFPPGKSKLLKQIPFRRTRFPGVLHPVLLSDGVLPLPGREYCKCGAQPVMLSVCDRKKLIKKASDFSQEPVDDTGCSHSTGIWVSGEPAHHAGSP